MAYYIIQVKTKRCKGFDLSQMLCFMFSHTCIDILAIFLVAKWVRCAHSFIDVCLIVEMNSCHDNKGIIGQWKFACRNVHIRVLNEVLYACCWCSRSMCLSSLRSQASWSRPRQCAARQLASQSNVAAAATLWTTSALSLAWRDMHCLASAPRAFLSSNCCLFYCKGSKTLDQQNRPVLT